MAEAEEEEEEEEEEEDDLDDLDDLDDDEEDHHDDDDEGGGDDDEGGAEEEEDGKPGVEERTLMILVRPSSVKSTLPALLCAWARRRGADPKCNWPLLFLNC